MSTEYLQSLNSNACICGLGELATFVRFFAQKVTENGDPQDGLVMTNFATIYQFFYGVLHNLLNINLLSFDMEHLCLLTYF
mgnify:CR=1 FL=1